MIRRYEFKLCVDARDRERAFQIRRRLSRMLERDERVVSVSAEEPKLLSAPPSRRDDAS